MGEARAQAKGKFPSLKDSLGDYPYYLYQQNHNHNCFGQMNYGVDRQGLHLSLVGGTPPVCPCPTPITAHIILSKQPTLETVYNTVQQSSRSVLNA